MEPGIDTIGAIGGLTFAALLWGVVAAFRPALELTRIPHEAVIQPTVLILGVGLAFVAEAAGELESENSFATLLLGLTIGLAALGLRSANQARRNGGQPPDTR